MAASGHSTSFSEELEKEAFLDQAWTGILKFLQFTPVPRECHQLKAQVVFPECSDRQHSGQRLHMRKPELPALGDEGRGRCGRCIDVPWVTSKAIPR